MAFCGESSKTNPFIHILALLFGMGSDLAVAGIWVELPILVFFLPEGWSLGSYMTIVLQSANISPVIYTIGHLFFPKLVRERPTIYFIATLGSTASLLLAFFWDYTSFIFGAVHSTALFGLHFCLAVMDCTSSIVFITAMGVFNDSYMTTFFLGEGLSGLIPALVALAQGAGDVTCRNVTRVKEEEINGTIYNDTWFEMEPQFKEPNFSVTYFFVCLCSMQVISIIAYSLLMYLPVCKKEHRTTIEVEIPETTAQELEVTAGDGEKDGPPREKEETSPTEMEKEVDVDLFNSSKKQPLSIKALKYTSLSEPYTLAGNAEEHLQNGLQKKSSVSTSKEKSSDPEEKKKVMEGDEEFERKKLNPFQYGLMLFLIAWSTFLANGFLLSIQSYSSLPYGSESYHLAVILATIANPLSCVMASFLPVKSKRLVCLLQLAGTAVSVYITILAALSPEPFLVDTDAGSALVVIAWILMVFILTYARVCGALILKLHGGRGLFWYGFMTQAGAAVGALVSFILVNVLNLFHDASACVVIA